MSSQWQEVGQFDIRRLTLMKIESKILLIKPNIPIPLGFEELGDVASAIIASQNSKRDTGRKGQEPSDTGGYRRDGGRRIWETVIEETGNHSKS